MDSIDYKIVDIDKTWNGIDFYDISIVINGKEYFNVNIAELISSYRNGYGCFYLFTCGYDCRDPGCAGFFHESELFHDNGIVTLFNHSYENNKSYNLLGKSVMKFQSKEFGFFINKLENDVINRYKSKNYYIDLLQDAYVSEEEVIRYAANPPSVFYSSINDIIETYRNAKIDIEKYIATARQIVPELLGKDIIIKTGVDSYISSLVEIYQTLSCYDPTPNPDEYIYALKELFELGSYEKIMNVVESKFPYKTGSGDFIYSSVLFNRSYKFGSVDKFEWHKLKLAIG